MVHVRKILFPTDFSTYSNQAYFHALALAETHKAVLSLVFVYNPGIEGGTRAWWREQLESFTPGNPEVVIRHVFLEGDPATEIVRYAAAAGIDMIVMGTHGRTGVDRMLIGSVAERVLRESPCSVLVIKLPRVHPAADRPTVLAKAAR